MDITKGTQLEINENVFHGYPNSRLVGKRKIVGTVVTDSYGSKRGQHTFTIEVEKSEGFEAPEVGKKIRRKGRNLYKNSKVLEYPKDHTLLSKEKHKRAVDAKSRKYWHWINEFIDGGCWDNPEKLDRIPDSWLRKNPEAVEKLKQFHKQLGYTFTLENNQC
tara:strand:+ start:253 stop:738 length:486 start_codon:yes stop_codon:yes gene_type:complete